MKKFILFFFTLLILKISYGQVNFGLKSGINIATTRDLIAYPKNRLGWYVGGSVHIPIHKKIFFQPELLFSAKGYRYEDLSDGEIVAMRLNYLTVPILFGYEIDNRTKVVLGTELGYLTKAINWFNEENFDASASFPRKFDIGLAIGIAYNITRSLGAEIRYNYGFKGLYQTDISGNPRSEDKASNRAFQIGAYYKFLK
ncbi:MAG: porin family protein [Flavisolibacter sp.]